MSTAAWLESEKAAVNAADRDQHNVCEKTPVRARNTRKKILIRRTVI